MVDILLCNFQRIPHSSLFFFPQSLNLKYFFFTPFVTGSQFYGQDFKILFLNLDNSQSKIYYSPSLAWANWLLSLWPFLGELSAVVENRHCPSFFRTVGVLDKIGLLKWFLHANLETTLNAETWSNKFSR